MRARFTEAIEAGRDRTDPDYGSPAGALYGRFLVRTPTGIRLVVIASDGQDWEQMGLTLPQWEHASVSTPNRCPTWEEMCWVKAQLWDDAFLVIQFHPPRSTYIDTHPFVLHLWRPVGVMVPMPPLECV